MNSQEKTSQFQNSQAVIDPDKIPKHVIKGIGSTILKILKGDKELQKLYEEETGKSYYK